MGPNQVGKAALSGWREMLIPAVRNDGADVALWPFSGDLGTLLTSYPIVVVETYPAEVYHHLGISWPSLGPGIPSGKRSHRARQRNAPVLLEWASTHGISLAPALADAIRNGFGSTAEGEDKFDAVVGLFGMLNIIRGRRLLAEPIDERTRRVEGWIFGRSAS